VLLVVAALVGTGATGRGAPLRGTHVQVSLGSRVIDRFRSNSIRVSGLTAHSVDVRLLDAIDLRGRAYQWTPYKWQRLRLRRGSWKGVLPAPALLGIYQIELRVDHGRKLISRPGWLERVFSGGTEARRSFPSPAAVIRHDVARLPGDNVLVAVKRGPCPRTTTATHDSTESSRLPTPREATRDPIHGSACSSPPSATASKAAGAYSKQPSSRPTEQPWPGRAFLRLIPPAAELRERGRQASARRPRESS
jgi:hypothetical protein